MIRLHVTPPQGPPSEHPLEGDSVIIGRGLTSDLVLADAFLSRQHARLYRHEETWWIEDLGSRNGTRVNGELLTGPRRLLAGDTVEISATVIEVRDGAAPAATTGIAPEGLGDATFFRSAADLLAAESRHTDGAGGGDLERHADRLRVLNEVHRDLGRSLALPELLERMLDRVFDHLRPERGAVYLRRGDGSCYVAARRSLPGVPETVLDSTSLVREVVDRGLAALVLDARTDERFAAAHSVLDLGVRSLIAAPLLDAEESLGMIVLDSRLGVRQFTEGDMELLVSIGSAAALRIRNVALAEEAAERRRMAAELTLARRIQLALLPERLPEVAGWQLHAGNLPSRGVSGDFYEVLPRRDGREVLLLVSDVSGKGVAASLLTASLEALLAAPIEEGLPPDEIAHRVSRLLYRRTPPEKYATAFLVVLAPASGAIAYTCAGHNPALLVRAGGEVERLGTGGVPLGLIADATFTAGDARLDPGDTLVLYTDGIVEATDPDDAEYGLERLVGLCREHRAGDPGLLARAVEADVERYVRGVPIADDRTLVVARRLAAG
jgi:serine phosphatase RsbU (regulator of sigma subunit)